MRIRSLGSSRQRRVRRALARLLTVTLVAVLFFGNGSPAEAVPNATWPSIHPPSLAALFAGPLSYPGGAPKQQTGTAKGHGHYVDASPTQGGAGSPVGSSPNALGPYVAPKPQTPASSVTRAIPGLGSFDPKTSRRLAAQATATSDMYQNADGSYTSRTFQQPVNFKDANGVWQPVDSTLVLGSDGRYHAASNALRISVANAGVMPVGRRAAMATGTGADAGSDPAGPLASLTLPTGQVVAYTLSGAQTADPTVDGATATYADILPSTDLTLTPFDEGLNEELVLSSPDAPSSWTFPLQLTGLTPRMADDGSVDLLDSTGARVAFFPHGHMYDSLVDPRSGAPADSSNVVYTLTQSNGDWVLQVTADSAWLHDPARVFPVMVDPTTAVGTDGDVYVDNDSGTTSANQNGTDLAVGTYDSGTTKARSFVSFGGFATTAAGNQITGASLKLYLTWAYSCTTLRAFNVSKVTQAWTVSGLSTASYPGPTIDSPPLGSLTPDPGVACTNTSGNRSVGVWVTVPLATSAFNDWSIGGPSTNFGLALTAASETDSYGWKRFTSENYSSGAYQPELDLTYTPNVAPQIDSVYPTFGSSVPTLTPELLATGHDPDNWPGTMTYDFKIQNKAGTQINDSGWTSATDYVVPSGVLSWGQSYTWTVQAKDGLITSGTPPRVSLSTAVPQPLITSTLAQNGGQGFDAAGGNYTTSATDAAVASVGPAVSVERSYNNEDPRVDGAFGAGWSSVVDTVATEQPDAKGTIQTVVITYPNGQDVAFGRNSDGTFVPPQGRYATFTSVTGGYQLVDKDGTTYLFTASTGVTGQYGLTSITDAQGRAETFAYTSGLLATMTGATGRALHFTWSTPTGATAAHVATVVTDPAIPGAPASALTWTYSYTGDLLTKVCSPMSTTACSTYSYGTGSQSYDATLNAAPTSYWRLNDATGTVATSAVTDNEGTDNGTYTGVTLGATGPFPGSTSTAATFDGTSSQVHLPGNLIADANNQTVSLWFKVASGKSGILLSYQADPITKSFSSANFTPALYVGTSGKLYGEFWNGYSNPLATTGTVTDNQWHQVVLAAQGTKQRMYLDGVFVGQRGGNITLAGAAGTANEYIGTGFIGYSWPDQPNSGVGHAMYFTGSIADVATFDRALTDAQVAALYSVSHVASAPLTQVTRPSGKIAASVVYDQSTNRVTQVTDANGGVWKLSSPVVTGSSEVYTGAVLSAAPTDYWRLTDSLVTDAVNQVNGNTATYSNVTLAPTGLFGPFGDTTASFNGTSSYLKVPDVDVPSTSPVSISMWFQMPNLSTSGGVLFDYQAVDMAGDLGASGSWTPALYVGTDGKLRGQIWMGTASSSVTSSGKVNDGLWHHVVLAASGSSQTMYLDGAAVGTIAHALVSTTAVHAYVGAGKWSTWPSTTGTFGYWPGQISDVAYFNTQLTAAQVTAQYSARTKTSGTPIRTITVTDPGNATITHTYDVATNRQISETDALGNLTQYGYDPNGFLNTVTDPAGKVVTTGHDVRGNATQITTCQNYTANLCSNVYYTYYPDDTSATLTPDPRNDMVLTMRDGRSSGPTDNTYLTTYTYDTHGNRTSVAAPLSRNQTTTYTDGTTVAAYDTGFAPAGLPATLTTPGGGVQSMVYFRNGDIAKVTDPAGMVTTFAYDALGRVTSTTKTTDTFPGGLTTSFTYNGLGQVVSQTDPAITDRVTGAVHTRVTSTVFDADGLPTSNTVSDTTGGDTARSTSTSYDAHDLVATTTDADGKVTTLTCDAYGNVIKMVGPDGVEMDTAYDAVGHVLTKTLKNYTGDPNHPTAPVDLVTASNAYYPTGTLASTTDANGWTTSYTYTDNGLTQSVTRTDGTHTFVQEQDAYDADGKITSQITNNGATTVTRTWDAGNRATTVTLDPAGLNRKTTYTYNLNDQPTTTVQSDTTGTLATTDDVYDTAGRRTSETIHDGTTNLVTTWHIDQGGLVTYTVDPNGNRTDYSYDQEANKTVVTGAAVMAEVGGGTPVSTHPTEYLGYDTFGEPVESKDPNGNVTSINYDAAGQVTVTHLPSYTQPITGTVINPTPSQTYDADGRVIASFDALSHETDYTYDQFGNAAKVTTPDGKSTTYTYDTDGDQLSVTDPTGAVSTATYDYLGRKATTTQVVRQTATNDTTTYTYGTDGRLSQVTSPTGVNTYQTYDAAGETLTSTDGAGNVTHMTYDGLGRLTKTLNADGTYTTVTYDPASRQTGSASFDAGGTQVTAQSNTYDNNGNVLTSTDGRGTVTTYTYDATNKPVTESQPISGTDAIATSFGYDADGNQTRFTDGRGNAFITTYNSWNKAESKIEPATPSQPNPGDGTFTQSYDADQRPLTQTSPGGVTVTNSYDIMGRLTTAHGAGADAATVDRTFGYDDAGRVTTATGSAGSDTFTYDDRGLLLTASGVSGSSSFGYNLDGSMTSRTDAAGTTTYGYDAAGRLNAAANSGTGVNLTVAYNTMDLPSTITYGTGGDVRTFGYDALQRIHTDQLKTSGGTTVASITYGYDANGNETSKATTGFTGAASNVYTYDLANRLASWNNGTTTIGYTYDKSGNRTQNGSNFFTYDARNQLQQQTNTGVTYHYTLRGTLSSTVGSSSTQNTTTDAFGQVATQGAVGGTTSTYTYDGLGRAIQSGMAYSGTGNTLAADGSATYTRDPGDALLGASSGSTNTQVMTDQHDDVVGQFAATGTSLAGSVTYDPLGQVLASSGLLGHLGYQSEWTDNLTGRVNMAARWYNTATGQFDTRDSANLNPVGTSVDADRFAYGDDNPLTSTDPTGHMAMAGDDSVIARPAAHPAPPPAPPKPYVPPRPTAQGGHVPDDSGPVAGCPHLVGRGGPCAASTAAVAAHATTVASMTSKVDKMFDEHDATVAHNAVFYQTPAGSKLQDEMIAADHAKIAADLARIQAESIKPVRPKQKSCDWYDAVCQFNVHKAAIVGGIAGQVVTWGCEALSAGAGSLVCAALGSGIGNVVTDAMNGLIHNVGDALGSFAVGAVSALAFAGVGAILGKLIDKLMSTGVGKSALGFLKGIADRLGGEGGSAASTAESDAAKAAEQEAATTAETSAGSTVEDTASSCKRHSFVPTTRVVMADGSTKAIKDIRLGDMVQSTDPMTGRTTSEPVVALHLNHDSDMADVTVHVEPSKKASPSGDPHTVKTRGASHAYSTVLHMTQTHPLWDATSRAWVTAGQFRVGDRLLASTAAIVTVTAVRDYTLTRDMRDLTVGIIHTYYVVAGDTSILVHNVGGMPYDACPVKYPVNGLRHGAYGEGETELDLAASGHTSITREVTFTDRNGNPFRADFIAKDPQGKWIAVETKTSGGGASGRVVGPDVVDRMDTDQVTGYYDLAHGGLTLSTDKLADYGFNHGDNFTVSSVGWSSKICPHC
jgi:RHS repeat-associated protein